MRRFAIFALFLLTLAGCTPKAPGGQATQTPAQPTAQPTAQTGSPAKPGELMTSPDYAVQVFLWGNAPTNDRDLKLAKDAGFHWIKQMFQWDFIEGKGKGQFEWNEPDRIVNLVQKHGLKIIARLDVAPKWARGPQGDMSLHGPPTNMQDYGDYVGAVAARYKGKIQAYQIWNEPNLAREWNGKPPSAKEYLEMMKVAYTAIKKADPNAIVINGGMSPTTAGLPLAIPTTEFLKQLYALGFKGYIDMLGVHAAGYRSAPEDDPAKVAKDPVATNHDPSPEAAKRVYAFRFVEDIHKLMVEAGDTEHKIAILEFGWTTDNRKGSPYAWFAVSEPTKADYLIRSFKWAEDNWRPWIGVMTVIYMCDPNWRENKDEQYYWCITDEDGAPLPAYDFIKNYLTHK